MRGLKDGVDSDERTFLVVSWKKMGWFCVVVSGSERSCNFSCGLEVSDEDLRCFNRAFKALVNYFSLALLRLSNRGINT